MEKEIVSLLQKIEYDEGLRGIPSGFIDLDRITNGFQSSNLIIIGGRPSMGKTSLLVSMIRNMVVDFNHKVLLFSLEMSSE